jgi:hypothetical protein
MRDYRIQHTCDICGKSRHVGNHEACSRKRQLARPPDPKKRRQEIIAAPKRVEGASKFFINIDLRGPNK